MSFGENLQTLRKAQNISQEQLAEKLDVSRQAVSKWESGGGYPETDKIIALCEFFGCSMDELMMGKVSVNKHDERTAYEEHYNRFSKGIALGVGLILFGVSLIIMFSEINIPSLRTLDELGVVIFLMFVAAAVALFIINGIEHENFRRQNPSMPEIYSQEELNAFYTGVFPKAIALGVLLVFIAVIQIIVFEEILPTRTGIFNPDIIAPTLFFILVGIAVMIFVYFGIQHDKYDIKKYNNEAPFAEYARIKNHRENLAGTISGIIMITATGLFFICGAFFEAWHPAWVLFPVGGLICSIVKLILGTNPPADSGAQYRDGQYVPRDSFGRRFLRKSALATALSGIIMLSVTMLYLILGFLLNLWHPGWIVFPLGALVCGIVSLVVAISGK